MIFAVNCEIILMEIQMPELDGLEATQRIRELDRRAEVPIIALTPGRLRNTEGVASRLEWMSSWSRLSHHRTSKRFLGECCQKGREAKWERMPWWVPFNYRMKNS